jgi:hypothetical protein
VSRRAPRFVADAVAGVMPALPRDTTGHALIVAPATVNGVHRVTRFDLTVSSMIQDSVVFFALVYIPEGINPDGTVLSFTDGQQPVSLYVPEQHVIATGVCQWNIPCRVFSWQSRSLASGDRIVLLTRSVEDQVLVRYRCSFSIAFG